VDRHCGLNPGKAPETLLADLRDGTLGRIYKLSTKVWPWA
jgi:hypothetical protein